MKTTMIALSIAALSACSSTASDKATDQSALLAETSEGMLRGTAGDGFVRFAGVRYAQPPVGPLRWRMPQPPESWDGVKDADTFGGTCPQPSMFMAPAMPAVSEDCLFVNVWKPADAKPGDDLPVLFWIHGGGWETGTGWLPDNYMTHFMQDDIVVVTVNYRLGRLGTFAHPLLTSADEDDGYLANYGFMDQIAALKWARENAEAFGGTADNLTIMGTSAGGGSVNLMMASPETKGLFSRGISQSAGISKTSNYLDAEHPNGTESAEALGKQWTDEIGVMSLADMRALPLETITGPGPRAGYGAVVDGKVLPDQVATLFEEGKIAAVPYLAGATSFEGNVMMVYDRPVDGVYAKLGELADDAKAMYARSDDDAKTASYRLVGDLFLALPSLHSAMQAAKAGDPTYAYYFDYVAEGLRPREGAYHGGDSYYTFDTFNGFHPLHDKVTPTELDAKVAETFHAYWVNFIKTGNPNGPGLKNWPQFEDLDSKVLSVTPDGVTVSDHPLREKFELLEPMIASEKVKFF